MHEEKVKAVIKCRYFGFTSPNGWSLESKNGESLRRDLMMQSNIVSRLSMDYLTDGNFRVHYKVLKSKRLEFDEKTDVFYSCIDAMVCYQEWMESLRRRFFISHVENN